MPPFDLDLLAITMTCSASFVFFPPVSLKSAWDVWLFYFLVLYFPFRFCRKNNDTKQATSPTQPSPLFPAFPFCVRQAFRINYILPSCFTPFPCTKSHTFFPPVRPLIFFRVSVVNSNYRGLYPFAHTIKYYTFSFIGLSDAEVLGSSPVRRFKYRKLETTTF